MTNPRVTATADLSLLYRQRKWCVCGGSREVLISTHT